MLRWISSLPPYSVSAREKRKRFCQRSRSYDSPSAVSDAGTADLHGELAEAAVPVGPDELGDVVGAGRGLGQRADRVDAHDLELGAVLGEAVAQHRVVERAVAAGELDQVVELALEADLLAEHRDAALEAEQRHRDLPAVAGLAEDHRLVRTGTGEEDLVELRRRR